MATRHFRAILAIGIGTVLLGTTVSTQGLGSQGLSLPHKEIPPRFNDFPVVEKFYGKPARVDLSSHPMGRIFRTRLRRGAQEGPNFAGHYALVWWGCGNECQQSLIVDLRTGKVYGLAESPSETTSSHSDGFKRQPLQSSRGADFMLTSRLVIADPPCPEDYNPCVSLARTAEPVRYYIIEKDGLRLIHKTPCWVVNGLAYQQQCRD